MSNQFSLQFKMCTSTHVLFALIFQMLWSLPFLPQFFVILIYKLQSCAPKGKTREEIRKYFLQPKEIWCTRREVWHAPDCSSQRF